MCIRDSYQSTSSALAHTLVALHLVTATAFAASAPVVQTVPIQLLGREAVPPSVRLTTSPAGPSRSTASKRRSIQCSSKSTEVYRPEVWNRIALNPVPEVPSASSDSEVRPCLSDGLHPVVNARLNNKPTSAGPCARRAPIEHRRRVSVTAFKVSAFLASRPPHHLDAAGFGGNP